MGSIPQEARKRVAIALALATNPGLLLLDEPAAGINHEETGGLTDLIRKVVESGVTVCLVEHKMRMVMSLSDRHCRNRKKDEVPPGRGPLEEISNSLSQETNLLAVE